MSSPCPPAVPGLLLDGTALVDARTGRIIDMDARLAADLGVTREAAVTTLFADLVHSSDLPAYRHGIAQLVAGEIVEFDACLRLGAVDGARIFSLTRVANALRELGQVPLLLVTVQSLVRQVNADVGGDTSMMPRISRVEMSPEYRDEMEELVRLRTRELVQALDAAQGANRAKNAFLAMVSHELRTPLNAIIGFTSLLLDGVSANDPDEQRKQLAIVKHSAMQLLDLVKEILDLSSIEAGHINLKLGAVPLRQLLEDQCDLVRVQATQRQLELRPVRCDDGVMVMADAGRLNQVVRNLLANAIKFTDAGHVAVTAKVLGNVVRVAVHDTGIGIPRSRHDDLFVAFERVDPGVAGPRAGTGLGLAISKRLIEAMGGAIGFDSEPGRGSTFWFVVPLAARSH